MSAVTEKVGSPRDGSAGSGKVTLYDKIHAGLDHALQLLLADDSAPGVSKAEGSPLEVWKEIMRVADGRREQLVEKEARKAKKQQMKMEKERKEKAEKEQEKQRLKEQARQAKAEREAAKARAAGVKTLDLSAAPSPVLSHNNSLGVPPPLPLNGQVGNKSPKRPPLRRAISLDSAKMAMVTEATTDDLLTRLQQVPLVEDVKAGTKKYAALVKWMECDEGKNVDLNRNLKTLILKLQRDGHAAEVAKANGRNSAGSSPRSLPDLTSETLDDRLKREKMEKKRLRREAIKRERQREKELERRRSTGSNGVTNGKKRRLGGFVVDSDEEEYEEGESEESEEEYNSGEEDEEDDEEEEEEEGEDEAVEFRVKIPAAPVATSNVVKTSPKSTTTVPDSAADGQLITATDQLKLVAARIREEELKSDPAAVPTYLSYNSEAPTEEKTSTTTTPAASSAKGKKRPLSVGDGSSVTSAIVLEDSDEDEEEESYELHAKVVREPKLPPPPPKSAAKQPLKQRASPAKKPNGNAKLTSKAKGAVVVPKSSTPTKKARKKVESESEDEAEFHAANEDGSSTDADEDMFDLNEDDVYVVESILEVKPGRTMLNNSGRATKEADLFLVKWEGYDELTWEPDANIPNRLIQFFHDREVAKRACGFQIDKFLQRKVAKNILTGRDEILYLIQWKNQPQAFWEIKSNLPEKTVIWLEKTSRASLAKPGTVVSGPSRKRSKK